MNRIIAESGFLCFVNFFRFQVLCFFVVSAPVGFRERHEYKCIAERSDAGTSCVCWDDGWRYVDTRRPRSLYLKV